MSWLAQSALAIVFLTPAWLAMPFFSKNYGVSGSVFAVWYFVGVTISIATFGVQPRSALVPSVSVLLALVAVGFVIGGIANNLIFSAVVAAPNPGLPLAVANITTLTTFLLAIVLSRLLPEYFKPVQADLKSLIGATLIIIGAAFIAAR
jgi:hypothetical protein